MVRSARSCASYCGWDSRNGVHRDHHASEPEDLHRVSHDDVVQFDREIDTQDGTASHRVTPRRRASSVVSGESLEQSRIPGRQAMTVLFTRSKISV